MENLKVIGIVERRLFDKNGKAKKQFKENILWVFLNKLGLDLRIPFLTGFWTINPIKHNTITTAGKQIIAQQLGGTTTSPVTAIAIGTGTPSSTALGSEITSNGGQRGAATIVNTMTTTTGDTENWTKTFTFTSGYQITEEGLFDNNTSGGNMCASQSFPHVDVASGDKLYIDHSIKIT